MESVFKFSCSSSKVPSDQLKEGERTPIRELCQHEVMSREKERGIKREKGVEAGIKMDKLRGEAKSDKER